MFSRFSFRSLFRRFSFRSLFRRVRDFFVPDEDAEELEIEDEEELEIEEADDDLQRRGELEQRLFEIEQRVFEIENELEIEISISTDATNLDELERQLDELERQLDEIELDELERRIDNIDDIDIGGGGAIELDEEYEFRREMADFFGVDVSELRDISIDDLEVLSRQFIFDTSNLENAEYRGSFSSPADLVQSPLFDLLVGGYGEYTIDDDGNISVYETDTDKLLRSY